MSYFYYVLNNVLYLKNYTVKGKTHDTKNVQQEIIFNSRQKLQQTVNHEMNLSKLKIAQLRKWYYLHCIYNALGIKRPHNLKIIINILLYNKINVNNVWSPDYLNK